MSASVARFDSLNSLSLAVNTCVHDLEDSPYIHCPIANDPLTFKNNCLVTLRAQQVTCAVDAQRLSQILRTRSNWQTIRNLELGLSKVWFNSWHNSYRDFLCCLFETGGGWVENLNRRMKLHQLILSDVYFHKSGVDSVVQSVDPGELQDLQLFFCSGPASLLRRWEKNKMQNLERLLVREKPPSSYSAKFLKQFGPKGTCRKLKTLEATCCWWPRWVDPLNEASLVDDDYHCADDIGRLLHPDEEESNEEPVEPDYYEYPDPPTVEQTRLQPFHTIRELSGNKEEGWGLEKLIIDMSCGVMRHPPCQHSFFEPFWRLRELAFPVSYEGPEAWVSPFVFAQYVGTEGD